MARLVLLRHGESEWNSDGRFAGWVDVDLTPRGEAEARDAGLCLAAAGVVPEVVHTSDLTRAVRTADLALWAMGLEQLRSHRTWRLNERHYGALQGRSRAQTIAEFGADQVAAWRRSYRSRPPPATHSPEDALIEDRYKRQGVEVPGSESIADVLDRMLPYWVSQIEPALLEGQTVLIVAHSNSLRALTKHLGSISEHMLDKIEVPTGVPILYDVNLLRSPGTRLSKLQHLTLVDRVSLKPTRISKEI